MMTSFQPWAVALVQVLPSGFAGGACWSVRALLASDPRFDDKSRSFDGANHLYHSSHVGLEARTVTGSELELPDLVWTHAFFGCSCSACAQTRFRSPASAPHAAAVRSSHAGAGEGRGRRCCHRAGLQLRPIITGSFRPRMTQFLHNKTWSRTDYPGGRFPCWLNWQPIGTWALDNSIVCQTWICFYYSMQTS